MVIESDKMEKPYARECINVFYVFKKLVAKPDRKILDMFVTWPIYLAFSFCVCLWLGKIFFINGDRWAGVIAGALIGILILCFISYLNCLKGLKSLLNRSNHVTMTFDEKGIEFDDHESRKFMVYWNAVQAVRVCKYGFYFIPNDTSVTLMGLSMRHYEKVEAFLKENNIEIPVYKQK